MPDDVTTPTNPQATATVNLPAESPYSFGLPSAAKLLANITGIGLVCLFFWVLQHQQINQNQLLIQTILEDFKGVRAQSRDDQKAYRDDLKLIHQDAERQTQATRELATVMSSLSNEVRILKDITVERTKIERGKVP